MSAPTNERTHDVYFTTSERRFYFRNDNRGVTLGPDHIAWTFDGKPDGAPFKNLVEVHLQSGGSWQSPVHLCEIVFADRFKLMVLNGNDHGLPDERQRTRYRDFVHDLHTRLAAHACACESSPITFTAGFSPGRYHLLMVFAVLLGLITIGVPLVALLITGEVRPLMVLVIGAVFIWPLKSMMEANAPRDYDPSQPPRDLVG